MGYEFATLDEAEGRFLEAARRGGNCFLTGMALTLGIRSVSANWV